MHDLLQATTATLRVNLSMLLPRTITSLMYRLIASAAMMAKVTRKKY